VSAFNSLVMKPQYAWFHLTSHFCTFICDIVLVIIFYCSFIVILPLPFNVLHAFSDAIAFFTDWISYSCATVGVQLSENDIYSQSCALLQESLFDTCCQSAGGSSNNATVIAATIGAIWGIGLVGAFLMWRYWSNRKPMQVTNIAEGCTGVHPIDGSEHFPPSIVTAPPSYQPEASDHPPPYQPKAFARDVDLPPTYNSTHSGPPSYSDPPPPYKPIL
jgi:hypothetical protein